MTDPLQIRVADADREQLAQELREHMLAGRLTSAEFEERVGRAYRAATRGELEQLRTDLPMSTSVLEKARVQRRRDLRRRFAQETSGSLTASLVCVAIWVAAGASGSFWPGWVIAFTLLPAIRNGIRLLSGGPDPETLELSLRKREARRISRERRHARRRELPR